MGQIQSIGEFLSVVRRRLWLILLVVVLGTAASVYMALGQQRVFEATAVAQIEAATVAATTTSTGATTSSNHRLRLLEQQLMSRDSLIKLIEKHGLYSDTDLSLNLKVSTLRESVRITQITDPNAAWGASKVPTGMMFMMRDVNPQTAADVANDFLYSLLERNRLRRTVAASQTLEFFQAEARRVEAQMATLEARIAEFKEKNAEFLPAGVAAQRTELGTLKTTLLELEQKLIELEATRTRQRSEVIERQSELLRQQQRLIEVRIANINSAISSAPEVERQFNALDRQLTQLQDQDSVITRRTTEAEMGQLLESQQQFERIEILETALVPENPVSGSRKKKIVLGAFMSVVLGLGLALMLEFLNPAIRTRAQLERQLDVRAVVAIPRLSTPKVQRKKRVARYVGLAGLVAVIGGIWIVLRTVFHGIFSIIGRREHSA